MRGNSNTIYFARESLFDKNGSRTHEHWVQIDETKPQYYEYCFGDERGSISTKESKDLAELLSEAFSQKSYYDMEVETDEITPKHNDLDDKEIVQFT